MLKKTPLYEEHLKLNANMVEFGGWDMPVQYSNVIDEHTATRTNAGLFDICHMGEIEITGPNSKEFIQKLITNDVEKLVSGKALYSTICNFNGGIIDDCFVYRFNKDKFMIVVNASNIEKDFNWMNKIKTDEEIEIKNSSDKTAKIDLQGPFSEKILQKLTEFDLKNLNRFRFVEDKINNIPVIISRTGYTGEDGFEIYAGTEDAVKLWNLLLEAGKEHGIKPIGLGARDTLRLECCYSLYGNDIDETTTPLEAGLGWQVSFNKNFIGKTALEKKKQEGLKRKIICFEMTERCVPRHNHEILKNGKKTGHVTSGTFSPTSKKGLGMGYVTTENAMTGNEVEIKIRDRLYKAKIMKRPFYEFRQGEKKYIHKL
ncbi:glycine cleavage system aminomethyltransferase GcvT [Candidatus Woesearchaeota archaeon]|nr:glycine cleavage system aminomethyltransferase GcvT [Candidatus Woesearchaeota archaeon]